MNNMGYMNKIKKFKILYSEFGVGIAFLITLSTLYSYSIHKNRFARYLFDKKHEQVLY